MTLRNWVWSEAKSCEFSEAFRGWRRKGGYYPVDERINTSKALLGYGYVSMYIGVDRRDRRERCRIL